VVRVVSKENKRLVLPRSSCLHLDLQSTEDVIKYGPKEYNITKFEVETDLSL
jgi:hypothetical protein